MAARRWLIGAIAIVACLLVAGRLAAGAYVDYRWYEALGAADVWRARSFDLLLLRGGAFVVGTLFVFANLFAVRSSVVSLVLPRRVGNLEIGEEVPGRYLMTAVVVLSVVVGGLLALPQDDWLSVDLVRHGESFGEAVPNLWTDVSFFTYWLPLENALHVWALVSLLAVTLLIVFLYALTPSLRWERGRLQVSTYVRRHFFCLGSLLLVLLGWSYRLDAYALFLIGSGPGESFTSVDKNFGIPANLVLALGTIGAAGLVFWSGWIGQVRVAFITVTAILIFALSVRQLLPPLFQRLSAPTDAEQRERPYQAIRASFTRQAYDLGRIARADSSDASPTLPAAARGVSLWDAPMLARAVQRTRRQRRLSGGMGWERRDARILALLTEEPTQGDAAESGQTWSLTRVETTMADERGGYVATDESRTEDVAALRAAIVYDSLDSYVVIADSTGVIAAPELDGLIARVAHAWKLQDPALLSSDVAGGRARIVRRRAVRPRVAALYPFMEQGSSVLPIVHGDTLYWAMHLYSASDWYPLSERTRIRERQVRYLRHAAVALVNSHSGRVTAVADRALDAIASSWVRRFPSMFIGEGELPGALIRAIPPAVDLAIVQAEAFAQVGLRGEFVPRSHLPRSSGGDTLFNLLSLAPFAVPGDAALEWAIPILDPTDRVRGLFIASGGASHEPRWRALPALGPRWNSIVERLQRTPDSAAMIAPRDARLLRGPIRVVPFDRGIAYLQTTYATRGDGTPFIHRVALFDGDSVSHGPTLTAAVGAPAPEISRPPATPEEFRARVEALYREMREALRKGDWTAFGAAYEALGKLVSAATR